MTTKQKLEHLLNVAADIDPKEYKGSSVSETIEGKLVVVQRTGWGKKVYGKRAPEFDATVDGEKVLIWKSTKARVLEALYHEVSEEYKLKQAEASERFRREQKIREAQDEAERQARQAKEAPARELANELMAKVWNKMVLRFGKQFNNDELAHFIKATVPPDGE